MEEKKRFWPFLVLIPLLAAAIAGWFVLPDSLVMQIGADGQPSNIMPKLPGLLIPVALGVLGAGVASSTAEEKHLAGYITLAAAVIVTAITFFWNL